MPARFVRRSPSTRVLRLGASAASLGFALLALPVLAQTQPASPPEQPKPQAQTQEQAPTQVPQPSPQQAPAASSPEEAGTAQGDTQNGAVTITAQKPLVQRKTDRDVYDVKQDPTAATGNAADVLNNVPGVTVDPDGSVQLRGSNSPQIYINGKPSALTQGENRAATLQGLSGDDIDSVETITSPGAAFSSDTGGGIINIVLKRGRALNPQTTLRVNAGVEGQGGISFSTGKTIGKLTLNGSVNVNRGGGWGGGGGGGGGFGGAGSLKSHSESVRQRLDPATGDVIGENRQQNVSKNVGEGLNLNLNAEYALTDNDTLQAQGSFMSRDTMGYSIENATSYDAAGNLLSDSSRFGDRNGESDNSSFAVLYNHRGEVGTSEDFKMQYRRSTSNRDDRSDYRRVNRTPAASESAYATERNSETINQGFSGDYTHPIGETRQIQLGWDLTAQDSEQYSYQSLEHAIGAPELPNPQRVSQFNTKQQTGAAYFIYEQRFGKLSLSGGLRYENFHQELYSIQPFTGNPGAESEQTYVTWSPNANLLYRIDDDASIKGIYSRRLNRPNPNALNPLIVYNDAQNVSSGNANLRPETVDRFELTYQNDRRNALNGQLQLSYVETQDTVVLVNSFLPGQPDVLLTTYDNAGSSKVAGVSLELNRDNIIKGLNAGFEIDYNYSEINGIDRVTGQPTVRKGPNSRGRLAVRYRPNDKDFYMMFVRYNGKRVDSQGYTSATTSLNANYQRQIIPRKLTFNINLQNILSSQGRKRVTSSSAFYSVSETFDPGPAIGIALSYTFGTPRNSQNQDGQRWRRGQGGPGGPGGPGGFSGGPGGGF